MNIKKRTTLRPRIIILFLLTIWTIETKACSCAGQDRITESEYNKAGEIFIGKVTSIEKDRENWEKTVTFEVIDQLKPTASKKEIVIRTPLDGAACGLSTEVGQKWYIFAYENDKGQLRAGLCGRSVHLNKKFRMRLDDIKYFFLEKRIWKKEKRRFRQEKRFIKKIKKRHANKK